MKRLSPFALATLVAGFGVFSFDCAHAQTPPLWSTAIAETTAPPSPSVKIPAALPPDVAFGRFIDLIRGHLLTGEELVKQRDWRDAHQHFLYPLEEIYGVIREDLRRYKTPPFDGALRALARTVKSRSLKHYRKALEKVERALAAADADLKTREPDWPRFELTVAVGVLRTASEEYEEAIENGRIAHSAGYRTAHGFILQADRMVESVAPELMIKNADALRDIRVGIRRLKHAFAAVDAPRRPPIEQTVVSDIMSRIELAAGKIK